ncbi:tRNA lysidine(34) synthetase TilS [Thermosulfurimonas marina]|uniref:tRNA(Ile)-lysidine synthase n=1 Tax=Thermosulfurimonas marina TaxID=2047767 RepID=A0A6H1WUQ7_9BACT|nr:tRNA lysidine(34) synthetase TilS [Thermosulfurimonas marina]QJA06920.1 tRNA lysidine(34) synthetase TilS [Thermosulfurimonas marina]
MKRSLLRTVKRIIERYGLLHRGDRVLVAVSGGVDSVVLLEVLDLLKEEYELQLFVAHYDHRLRKASLRDSLFVYQLAKKKGLPYLYGVSLVKEYARREGLSLEMAGRELRYRFFERLRRDLDLHRIALAHQADDLAEEVLLRFLRGAGRRGLAGIPVKREAHIIRPLLFVSRQEILDFARERGLSWVEDESNRDPRFVRNRVRHLLIPFLEEHFHPRVRENLKRTALILAEEEELIDEMARKALDRALVKEAKEVVLRVPILRGYPEALRRRVFWLALSRAGVSLIRVRKVHLEALENLLSGKARGPVPLPGDFRAVRGPGILRLLRSPSPVSEPFFLEIYGEGEYLLPGGKFILERGASREASVLDPERISFPLVVRSRRPGDRIFWPKVGHKRLKKFFWEQGIPPEMRDLWPLVEYQGEIVAIPGYYVHPAYQARGKEGLVLRFVPHQGVSFALQKRSG